MTVPVGGATGRVLAVATADRAQFHVVVPPGCSPGQQFEVCSPRWSRSDYLCDRSRIQSWLLRQNTHAHLCFDLIFVSTGHHSNALLHRGAPSPVVHRTTWTNIYGNGLRADHWGARHSMCPFVRPCTCALSRWQPCAWGFPVTGHFANKRSQGAEDSDLGTMEPQLDIGACTPCFGWDTVCSLARIIPLLTSGISVTPALRAYLVAWFRPLPLAYLAGSHAVAHVEFNVLPFQQTGAIHFPDTYVGAGGHTCNHILDELPPPCTQAFMSI